MKKFFIGLITILLLSLPFGQSLKQKQEEKAVVFAISHPTSALEVASATPSPTLTPIKSKSFIRITNDKKFTKSCVNFRKSSSKKSKIIMTLKIGTKVKRINVNKKTKWAYCKVNGKKGYIYNKYLSSKKPKIITKKDTTLKGVRKERADRIAKVCIDSYKKYGVLPSVCVGQAFQETGIGTAYNNGNLWGICSNRYGGYTSIEAGCLKYLRVINNGYYKGAPFNKSYSSTLRKIAPNYCPDNPNYANEVISLIEKYNLTDYDKYIQGM